MASMSDVTGLVRLQLVACSEGSASIPDPGAAGSVGCGVRRYPHRLRRRALNAQRPRDYDPQPVRGVLPVRSSSGTQQLNSARRNFRVASED